MLSIAAPISIPSPAARKKFGQGRRRRELPYYPLWTTRRSSLRRMNWNRKHAVHLPLREQFNNPVIVFVTVCTKNRKPILANDVTHALLRRAWIAADSWLVGRYVVMPDHV